MYNLEINGLGQSGGGVFGEVRVEGIGRFSGDVKCINFNIEGVGFAKEVECEQSVAVEGVFNVKRLKASQIRVSGMCRVKEQLKALKLNVEGYLSVTGAMKVEHGIIEGKVKFKEAVEAEMLDLTFVDHSSFDVIGGSSLRIKRSLGSQFWHEFRGSRLSKKKIILEGQLLEGENIDIEYCHVKQIYGDVVKIGPGCVIEEVEYKDKIEIDSSSIVKVSRQV